MGAVAIPELAHRQSEGGLPRAEAEGVVWTSALLNPTPPCAVLGESDSRSDERWAMDVTPIACGQDGCGHLTAKIDCHDREIIGAVCHR